MKKTTVAQNGLIWFGAGVSLAEILTGTYFASLGMALGMAAILRGHVIGGDIHSANIDGFMHTLK